MELKKLQYKHEASILHNTSRLMLNDLIYSGLDGVLVALNGGKKRKVCHIPRAHIARTSESIVSSLPAPRTNDVLHSLSGHHSAFVGCCAACIFGGLGVH